MSDLAKAIATSALRAGLAGFGGFLAAKGVVTESDVSTAVDALAAGIPIVTAIGWGAYQKYRTAKKLAGIAPVPK